MKKKSDHPLKVDQSLSLDDTMLHPVMEWVTMHWQNLLYGFLAFFALLFALYLWFASGSSQAEGMYKRAEEEFAVFQLPAATGEEPVQQEAFASLSTLLQDQPQLRAKYDALMAQTLIDRGDTKKAMPFAQRTFQRMSKDSIPMYEEYAAITLLEADKKYAEAAQRSILLKERMEKEFQAIQQDPTLVSSSGPYLYAFNLLRIPFLQQYAGAKAEELQGWQEWQELTSPNSTALNAQVVDRKAIFTVNQIFAIGSLSLDHYVSERIQLLSMPNEIQKLGS